MSKNQQHQTAFHRLITFSKVVMRNFYRDNCFILASSVVYTTLISIIPFSAFIVSLLTAFDAFDKAKESFLDMFTKAFGSSAGLEVFNMFNVFINNAGKLGGIGLISFFITSVILINRVWVTVNQIYHTSMNRNQLGRFTQFITVLVVGTLLLSAYFSVVTMMSDLFSQYFAFGLFMNIFGIVGPWLIIGLSFFLLIFFIPNTKVKAQSAFLGAVVGTISFQIGNAVFNNVVLKVMNYSIIYGSFATLFIGLIWIYVWWVIIFGAIEVAYVHQYHPDEKSHKGLPHPPAEQLACGFDILNHLSSCFKQGQGAMSVKDLGIQLKIPDRTLYTYLDLLEQSGFIIKMERSGHHYIPARPLEDLHIKDVARIIYGDNVHDRKYWSEGEQIAHEIYEKGVPGISYRSFEDLHGIK